MRLLTTPFVNSIFAVIVVLPRHFPVSTKPNVSGRLPCGFLTPQQRALYPSLLTEGRQTCVYRAEYAQPYVAIDLYFFSKNQGVRLACFGVWVNLYFMFKAHGCTSALPRRGCRCCVTKVIARLRHVVPHSSLLSHLKCVPCWLLAPEYASRVALIWRD